MNAEILIQNGSTVYAPCVEDGIQWTTERKGSPGKLSFDVIYDDVLNIQEGNAVQFKLNGQKVFYGYIFTKKRDKDKRISITCYDQLRYFKNKDTYCYTGKTAAQVLTMICADFLLNTGYIEETGYIIPQRIESNKTLFDIVQNSLDDTLLNTKTMYCLYDDFGQVTLQNVANMRINLLIDAETGQNFDYESTIDENVYNKIKLTYDNESTGKREVYIAQDSNNIANWGVLQYYDTLQKGENAVSKVNTLLDYYNKKARRLKVTNAWGDIRVRAGVSPVIQLNLGDITVNNFMMCDKVTHKFSNNEHTMDLTLIGGEFIA